MRDRDIALKIVNLKKSFHSKTVVDVEELTVKKGEKVALIGPSGAGKTTLLNLICGTLSSDNGCVMIKDMEISSYDNNKQLALHIGILRQQFDLVDELSVLNNVLCGRFNKWGLVKSLLSLVKPIDKKLALAILQTVGLSERASDIAGNLSGGEKQRVAISRLIMQDPDVVLCDEPVASLDPLRAKEVLELLSEKVYSHSRTLITTLHSVSLAMEYFDRIIALKEGKIFFDLIASEVTKTHIEELYNV